ncbi:uncharacterized protein LOC141646364 [Silene latifolia]|uniref:uncharacterized protein LOC141646364 n=1 Tax=Silene latifolia TaxID=37657 RepID=UPI003D774C1B
MAAVPYSLPNLEYFKELEYQQKFDYFAEYLHNDELRNGNAVPFEEHVVRDVIAMRALMKSDVVYTISEVYHLTALHNLQQGEIWSGQYARCANSLSKNAQTKLVSTAANWNLNFKVLLKKEKLPVSRTPKPSSNRSSASGSRSH